MDRLSLYNSALLLCGERKLDSLTESRESRRLLDTVWDDDGVRRCLEAGQWQFAIRASKFEYSEEVTPPFGFRRAFDKPEDFIRTAALCSDEYFREPLLHYTEEQSFWFADLDEIYVKYVSDDEEYGSDFSLWPGSFARFAEAYFALEIVHKLTNDEDRRAFVKKEKKERLSDALAKDAMAEPTSFYPEGSWVRSRRSRNSRRDRGNRGSLIG